MEPRFTCNLFLQTRQDATKVMQDIATIFRGMMYVAGGTLKPSCDRPADMRYHFTCANVKDGKFTYMGSGQKARHTAALVSWNDMGNFGRQKVEYVPGDEASIARFGIRQVEVAALGCTSRGQAHRLGKYVLLTEQYETDTVAFSVGLEGNIPAPGDIIEIADPLRAGKRMGGRALASTLTSAQLDAVPEGAEIGNTFKIVLPSGMPATRIITAINLETRVVEWADPLPAQPVPYAVWIVESETLNAQTFRVLSVAEKGGIEYAIVALQYVGSKYGAIENNLQIEEPPIGSNGGVPGAVTGLTLRSFMRYGHNIAFNVLNADWDNVEFGIEYVLNADWDNVEFGSRYIIQWKKNNGPWSTPLKITDSNFDFENPFAGTYICRVWAENFMGIPGPSAESEPFVIGNAVMPTRELTIDENGVVDVDCDFVQFRLVLTRDVVRFNFINVAPQDSIIVDIRNTGNFNVNFGNNVIPIEGFTFVMPQGDGAFAVIGMTTMDAGVSWLLKTAAQTASEIYEPLTATISPSPASDTWDVPSQGFGAPSVTVEATPAGGDGDYTHEWFRVDTNGGVDFLIDNAASTMPTFLIPAGSDAYGMTQTWRYRVTDGTFTQGTRDVDVTLARTVAAAFGVSAPSPNYDSCFARIVGPSPKYCSPSATVPITVVGNVGSLAWSLTKISGDTVSVWPGNSGTAAGSFNLNFSISSGGNNVSTFSTYRVDVTDTANGNFASVTFDVNLERTNDV